MMQKKYDILLIDDSVSVRLTLKQFLLSQATIGNVITANNGKFALEKLKFFHPDVIILDLEMPEMSGLHFLKKFKPQNRIPVIVFSQFSYRGGKLTLEALQDGAFDFVLKPKQITGKNFDATGEELLRKIEIAAIWFGSQKNKQPTKPESPPPVKNICHSIPSHKDSKLILIGASTGGTRAIEEILIHLKPDLPPIVVAIHMPENFTRAYADRLNTKCRLQVVETRSQENLQDNTVYVCPGGHQTRLIRKGIGHINIVPTKENGWPFAPCIDELFASAATVVQGDCVAVLLTGMGKDGARGMEKLHAGNALTIAQDETTSVVWGMPRAAIERKAVDRVLPVQSIADCLMQTSNKIG